MENTEEYKPLFATIDGIKKGPFSAEELSGIFQKGGFKTIYLSNNQKAINERKQKLEKLKQQNEEIKKTLEGFTEYQAPTIANVEFYNKSTPTKEIVSDLIEKGWKISEINQFLKTRG